MVRNFFFSVLKNVYFLFNLFLIHKGHHNESFIRERVALAFAVVKRYWILSGSGLKRNDILLPHAVSTAEVPFSKSLAL